MQAHLLVCFLALALWRTLEQWMRAKGLGTSARRLVKQLATAKSVDVLLSGPTGQHANRTASARRRHARACNRPAALSSLTAPAKRPARHRECSAEKHP